MAVEQSEATAAAPVRVTAEQLGLAPGDEHAGQLEFDLGNLSAFDPAPLDADAFSQPGPDREARIQELASSITQSLVAQLFALPAEAVAGGRVAQLPEPSTRLPREKPLPKPKALTKWQKYAQEKGIRKRKRSSLAFDEEAGEWRRRHGYKRANNDNEVPIIEATADDKVGEDPFSRLAEEKRDRVRKNAKQQLGNLKDTAKAGGTAALPATLKLATNLPEKGKGKAQKRKELKDDIKLASRMSGVSTASMGKFDKRLPGEKPNERTALGHRRKFASVTDTATERESLNKYADKFLRERADDVLDVRKAIGKFEAAAREERHAAKQEEDGEEGGGSRGKGGRGGRGRGGRGRGSGGRGGSSGRGGSGGRGGKGGGGRGGGSGRGGGRGGAGLGARGKSMKGGGGRGGRGGRGKKGAR